MNDPITTGDERRWIPQATFDVGDLLDRDNWKNGPLVVYWNQDRWIEPNNELSVAPLPPRKLRYRFRRLKPYTIQIRIAPPKGEDLNDFGIKLARVVGVQHKGAPRPGDSAIWLPAAVWARDAAGALASAGRVLTMLKGINCSAVGVKVEAAA